MLKQFQVGGRDVPFSPVFMPLFIAVLCILLLFVEGCVSYDIEEKATSSYTRAKQNSIGLVSPSNIVSARVFTNELGQLKYATFYKNAPVVLPSSLGITIDGVALGDGVKLGDITEVSVDDTYETRGNDAIARNHYIEYIIQLAHLSSNRKYSIAFRLYDDGIAYRYLVPAIDTTQLVTGEASSWVMPDNSKAWFFERDSDWKLMSYAGWWKQAEINQMPTISKQGPVQGTPIVFQLGDPKVYAVATKAALYNYSGMRLKAMGDNTFTANFTEGEKGFVIEGEVITPWRVTMLAESLNSLVNSDLIENLNPAPDAELFADTDYIKPGRSVWSWMSIRLGTIQDQYDYVDKAAALGFEYSLIDDGWKEWPSPWKTLEDIADYANDKGVQIWVWVHSKDINNPADDYQQMQDYLDKVKASGAIGVKTDFMNSEAKALIDFEINFLEKSAERKLLVNFHGSHSATGESRTYPNEMTREGIRGIEVNMHENQHLPPSHNVTLPFTRFLVGHGDYTPVYYTNPGPTSLTHQLATPIVFYSPVQVYAESPDILQNHPEMQKTLSVLKDIPTVWDETIVLEESELGQVAAFARRSGNRWFIGVLNNESPRNIELSLSFLDDGKYIADIVEDDLARAPLNVKGLNKLAINYLAEHESTIQFSLTQRQVRSSDILSINMTSGGGYVAVLSQL